MSRDRVQQVFSPNVSPAISVSRGETIVVETQDCYQGLLAEVPETRGDADRAEHGGAEPAEHGDTERAERAERATGIPVTGPIYVEDAHIGDVLSIQVKEIKTAGTGVFAVRPETGVPGQDIQKPQARVLEVNENQVHLDDRLKLPLRPVIGSMGVAAKHGEIDTVYPGRHGGNMDTLEITTGSRIYLPVQVNGALLSLGDVKACVGDGQIAGSGVEVEAEVTLRVDTLPGGRFSWPRVESKGEWITITSASTVDQAARLAIAEMVKWITQDKGLDFETAYALVSLGGSLRVSQWGNPLTTARMVFPKRLINKLKSVPTASGRLNYRSLPPAANGDSGGETVAADAEQPASRSSRRSGSGRSQKGSGRSRQSGARRGTRQKSNGAPSSAGAENSQAENSQKEAPGQQEAADRQEAVSQQEAPGQQEAASKQEATPRQDAVPQQDEAVQQETAPRKDATTEDRNVEAGPEAGKGNGHRDGKGRTGRSRTSSRGRTSSRRRTPAAKKDGAPDPAQPSSDVTGTAPEAGNEPKAGAAPTASEKPDAVAASAAGDGSEAVSDTSGNQGAGEGSDSGNREPRAENGTQPEASDRKPAFGRRQRRTVRRA